MIIDSHMHIGLNGWTEKQLLDYMDGQGIEKSWLLTWDEENPALPLYYQALDINEVERTFRNHPDRIVPFYAPDPARKDWKEKLSHYLDKGFSGCGELKVPQRWNEPAIQSLLAFLNKHKLPLIFHMELGRKVFVPGVDRGTDWFFKRLINERFNGKSGKLSLDISKKTGLFKKYFEKRLIEFPGYLLDFKALEEAVSEYSGISFIAHGPHTWNNFSTIEKEYLFLQDGPFRGEGKLWELLDRFQNFYCDLSGHSGYTALSRNHQISRQFLDRFQKKILFGTDNSKLGHLKLLKELNPGKEALQNILFENANRIA